MEWLKIATSTELVRVCTDDIVYVMADGNYSDIHLCSGKTLKLTFKLHYFEETFARLKDNHFIRLGRSIIVNKNYIQVIKLPERQLVLADNRMKDDVRIDRLTREALVDIKSIMEKGGDNGQEQ